MALLSKVFNLKSDNLLHQLHRLQQLDQQGAGGRKMSPISSAGSNLNLTPSTSAKSTSSSLTPSKSKNSMFKKTSANSPQLPPAAPPTYSVSIKIESPPVILYGTPAESTGSILSGLLKLTALANVELVSVTLSLIQTMRYTKPFILPNSSTISNCSDCTKRTQELARWDLLSSPTTFPAGVHAYPFSHLLPGSLPPTSKLGSSNSRSYIKYDLVAEVVAKDSESSKKLVLPINVSRLILRGPDRNSLRIFPPTDVTAMAVLPNVIYPKSVFALELKLDNMVNPTQPRRWRMRKSSWRIEENIKIRANVCEAHTKKLDAVEHSLKKAPQKKDKASGLHHSTIQTNMSLMYSPSAQFAQSQSQPNEPLVEGQPQQEDQIIDDGSHDIEETIRSGPQQAQQSFLEDFGGGRTLEHQSNHQQHVQPQTHPHTHPHPQHHPQAQSQSRESPSPNLLTPEISASQQQQQQQLHLHLQLYDEKKIYLEETRTISYGDVKAGWKSDFSGTGKIELVANISAAAFSTGSNNHITLATTKDRVKIDDDKNFRLGANVSCDIDDPNLGVFVNHTLIIEVVVTEELVHRVDQQAYSLHPTRSSTRGATVPRGRSSSTSNANSSGSGSVNETTTLESTSALNNLTPTSSQNLANNQLLMGAPTGAARVLRMQFKLPVTERSGLGIAWDDEVPPTYADVRTLSPPSYQGTQTDSNAAVVGSTSAVEPDLFPTTSTASMTPSLVEALNNSSVIYGRGETPIVGNFGVLSNGDRQSLDAIVDTIQDLSI